MEKYGKEEQIKLMMARNPRKWIKNLMEVFNSMCDKCKVLVNDNPGRPSTDYCDKCQAMAKDKLENLQ